MTPPASPVRIGTAGWAISRDVAAMFPDGGSRLERYARRFSAVEVNSAFYRPHRRSTYERWAANVPDEFRFCVKVPKLLTHESRLDLENDPETLPRFLAEIDGLGAKLGCLLVQLPPSLSFDPAIAKRFFAALRHDISTDIVCEPRHATWFADDANALLADYRVGRVVADPPCDPRGALPGGHREVVYVRLHGAPHIYHSDYDVDALRGWSEMLSRERRDGRRVWCVFDNTAAQRAVPNAMELLRLLS